ncbi:MAG: glycosyltransferase family 2 protein [Tateyamaria sp.]|uniref:glycosyltransferase family 2 protein n=1 Tax=Tateyamaria sp. TaxID=1929288 RepID=UPI003273B9C4
MTHQLVVSIINYRTADMTLDCVRSVLEDIGELDVQVVIVDNCSEDGSEQKLTDWIAAQPDRTPVHLVSSNTNSGFSGGHNQGMAAMPATHYLLLNSDARVLPGCLSALLTEARTNPDAGLYAPQIEHEDGTIQGSCFRFHTPFSEFIRGANSGPVTKVLKRWNVPLGTDPDPRQIGWASFACIMLDERMVRDIGPMDEGYFLYFEDAEYCLRAHRAGWRVQHCPNARMIHFRGGSAPVKSLAKARARLPAYYYSSRTRFFFQAYGHLGLWAANLMWAAGRILALGRRLMGRHSDNAKASEGHDIWTNIFRPLGPSYAPADRS